MLFAALSGSSPATVAAVGSIAIAGMVRSGYPQAFGAGIVCNAGTLGILIPPSIVMVVYAAATETSVGKLFIAGVVPGLLLGLILMVVIYIVARVKKLPAMPRVSLREWLASARKALWGLLLMVIILGGIYSGAFTPTEAAAVAAVYSAFVALFVYRDMRLSECPKVLLESGKLTIMLMFIIANAMLFAPRADHRADTRRASPAGSRNWGLRHGSFLLVVNIVLLIAGNFMEPSAIILILAPIFFPIAMKLGIDPIHLGIVMVVNMEIGLVHPPVGLNLFVTSAVTGMPLGATIRRGAAVADDPAAVPDPGDLRAVDLAVAAGPAGHELRSRRRGAGRASAGWRKATIGAAYSYYRRCRAVVRPWSYGSWGVRSLQLGTTKTTLTYRG